MEEVQATNVDSNNIVSEDDEVANIHLQPPKKGK